jgi:hypothetical protein
MGFKLAGLAIVLLFFEAGRRDELEFNLRGGELNEG